MVMLSAPALAMSPTWRSGRSTMRCTSRMPPTSWTRSARAETTIAPKVMGGTKWPSMTSTWMTRAPTARSSETWEPSLAKSADRIDGATRRSRSRAACAGGVTLVPRAPLDLLEHAALAVVALDDRRAGHPHDRGVLAAVRTDRDQLIATHAVDAAVVARHGGGPQPRLPTAGAFWAELGRWLAHYCKTNRPVVIRVIR